MRVTDGRLDHAASHDYTASLQAHRQAAVRDQARRVELTEDARITLSGVASALDMREAAQDLVRSRGFGPGLGHGMGLGLGLGQGVGVRARGVPAMHMEAPVPVASPAVAPEEQPDPSGAESVAAQAPGPTAQDAHGASSGTHAASSIVRYEDGSARVTGELERYA